MGRKPNTSVQHTQHRGGYIKTAKAGDSSSAWRIRGSGREMENHRPVARPEAAARQTPWGLTAAAGSAKAFGTSAAARTATRTESGHRVIPAGWLAA